MTIRPRINVIAKEDFVRIHEASLKILKKTGVVFNHDAALSVFKKHGAKIENKIVYLSEKMVEAALENAPSRFDWQARNPQRALNIGDGNKVAVQPNIGPINIMDAANGLRPGKLEDYINIQKICQASDVVSITGGSPVDLSDVAPARRHLAMIYQAIKHTDKPVVSYTVRDFQAEGILNMVEIAMGCKDYLKQHHCIAVSVSPLSPLAWAPDSLEMMLVYAKRNQIVYLATAAMAGITAPISLIGTTVQQNAEILSGLVLTQLVRPGVPVVYSGSSVPGYLKAANFIGGSPETMLINIPNLQLGKDFYKLPVRTMSGITDSQQVDCQAGLETMQNIMGGVLGGADIILESLGILDSVMTTCYEKMIIDEEIISRVLRIREGVDTSDLDKAVAAILETGHNSSFLTHQTTFDGFRQSWIPTISNWDKNQEDLVERAHQKYQAILRSAPVSMIDDALDKELQDYMESEFCKQ